MEWEQEWGHQLPTLLQYQKNTGKTPSGLQNMPVLPFYLEEILNHFYTLSRSRQYYAEIVPTKTGQVYTVRRPNPIDVSVILSYNANIAKVLKDCDFLDIIQTLDHMYMQNAFKKG